MATADTEASTASAGSLRRGWEKIATVLAVIGLVDVTGQLIKWAALIHWITEKYAIARAWLFGWLPWHIPPEWHDPIVLFLIFFSLTNVGVYRKSEHTIVSHILRNLEWVNILSVSTFIIIAFALFLQDNDPQSAAIDIIKEYTGSVITILSIIFVFIALLFAFVVLSFAVAVLAWRWVLTTAAIFCVLIAINQAYVVWLEPLMEHH
jgi:hypothetical protein